MILQIKKLAIVEDASPDNVVNLVPVIEGPEGSAVFGISNEHEQFFIEDRQTYVDRGNPTLEIAVLKPDSSDITQLETWVNNQTDVYISAYTIDGGFFFGNISNSIGAVKLVANEQLSDNDLFSISVRRQTTPGFDPSNGLHQNGFWAGENLLGAYEWADNDGDNVADGWTANSFTSTSFSGGQQTLTTDGSGVDFTFLDVLFPFEGVEMTFSLDVDTYNAVDNMEMKIEEFDTSASQISSSVTTITSTGRKNVVRTTSTGNDLVRLRCVVVVDNTTTGTTVSEVISDPCLRIGTGTTYTKF